MALRAGQVVKVVEGRGTLMAMARRVQASTGKETGLQFSYIDGDGLRESAFAPKEIIETAEVVVIEGSEFGSSVQAMLILFKNDQLDLMIGPLVIVG